APLVTGRSDKVVFTLQNHGADAENVVAIYTFDGDISIDSVDSPEFPCAPDGPSTLRCTSALLRTDGKVRTTVNVVAGASGSTIRVTGRATASGALYRPQDAQASRSLIVAASAALT